MPAHNAIELRFLRQQGTREPCTDDILEIKKMGENMVRATYREREPGGSLTIDTQLMGYQQLFAYLYRIFWVLSIDTDPFESVQLRVPGYPCVLLSVSTLQQNLTAIMELMISTCWNWPGVGRITVPEA
jgi:hypothetical protein